MTVLFDRAALLAAVNELADGLNSDGVAATIWIVGGAALSIGHYERAATTDVDVLLSGDIEAVSAMGLELAHRHDWPDNWLNDAVKAFYYPGESMKDRGYDQHTTRFAAPG